MVIRFPVAVLSLTALLGGLIYILHLYGLVTPANEVYARTCALGLFVAGFALLGLQKIKNHKFSWGDIYKNDTFIIFCLTVLLASLFLKERVSFYAIGLFAAASLIRFLYTRKFSAPPKLFYFIFAYALLMFFGTIGTPKGFRLPDQTLSFYILPLAFCCSGLSKKTLLQIGEVFFKTGIIFMMVCALYWFYNLLHLDVSVVEWLTGKTGYNAQMIGWEEQAHTHHIWFNGLTKDSMVFYSSYFFVDSWAYYYHPSFVSIVLLGGLITGFYLYHKKENFPTVTKGDLLLYTALCLFILMLFQSRIGIVGFLLITGITGLYYLKLKTRYFNIGLLACLLLGSACLMLFNDKVSDFVNDETRDSFRRIAMGYIQDNLYWGNGFNQQQAVLEPQAEKMRESLPGVVYPNSATPIHYVHNQFLGNMVQFGIWGLLALLALLVAIGYYAVKNHSYLLQIFLCFLFFFMLIEEPFFWGGYISIITFITFFTAISEADKIKKLT